MGAERRVLRCAVYTRKSSEHGLEQDFNSLHAQRESAEAYIKSQAHEGWKLVRTRYDDGGLSGGTMERPALKQLLADIAAKLIDVVVVYKVDRLTRSLTDFAKLVEIFDARGVSFVSVTQQFNTTTSMGRLTLNVLLSFAQFEREVAGERIRDKFAASRRKGMWMGGNVPLGYDVKDRRLVVNDAEAKTVRLIFQHYLELGCVRLLKIELDQLGIRSKQRVGGTGRQTGGRFFSRGALYYLLRNRVYRGEAVHKGIAHPGEHAAIIDETLWEAVQAKLSADGKDHRRGRAASGALLMGLLFDDRGNRMSPTHTTRKASRYRYYVSQAVLQGRKSDAGSIARISADELEGIVVQALRGAFLKPQRDENGGGRADRTSVGQYHSLRPGAPLQDITAQNLLACHVERIVLHAAEIEILLESPEDVSASPPGNDGGLQALRVPLERRPKDRKEIILASDDGNPSRQLDRSLVVAVARGRMWMKALRRGEYADTADIAAKHRLSEAYVRRILRLAFLVPDLVEAIAQGRQPRSLTPQRVLASVHTSWAEQRRRAGPIT
jgi:site-specific DNA recombinase